ncbi:HAMP domain-containing sensor histidine kinase [Oxalobacteraceae bacterium R-40]|uniref:histidine kinase n=1 Tax=Keguizhuia sedimenti TaxID=3064264 RepID=A0ABU1BLE3_9BURK|nr:HAMP domain-containing sensor histidine kinase [Oxalobacteraceae bacterium R-40]
MNGINVLVVDDFPQNLVATEAILSRPGLNVLKAASGEEALELLLAHEVALALIDVQMPGMDGFELAEIIRGNRRTSSIPLIFMTAAAQEGTRTFRGYQAGAVDFLNKPVNPDVLRGKVEVFAELFAQKKQIQQQVEELRQALQVNELFIAVLGHDLRTPLSAILHGAELIQLLAKDEKVAGAAKRIQSSGERMNKMVQQLLDVAQIRSGSINLSRTASDYRKLCTRIVEEIQVAFPTAAIRFECHGDVNGTFDTDRMAQVLSNLVSNAVQHGEPNQPVFLSVDGSKPAQVTVCVQNKGSIPADTLDRIFKPFHTTSAGRSAKSGLGLGLYIVKQFIEAHCGSVKVSSNPVSGTTFELTLPR